MVVISVVTGAYKPTYNWGASHCHIVPIYTLWLFNIAMENGPFIDDL